MPFNPNPPAKAAPKSQPAKPAATKQETKEAAVPTPATAAKTNVNGIDKTPLGLSDEVLAKRAAKFGIVEKENKVETKKEESKPAAKGKADEKKSQPAKVEEAVTPLVETARIHEGELTPNSEMAERIAVEEEKKRKRALKFGTGAPASETKEADKTEGAPVSRVATRRLCADLAR
jgi:SAP domain-containing ribonucleoprotein